MGSLPDMGCALRVASLIEEMTVKLNKNQGEVDILDVGCATGHFFHTFLRRGLPISKYVGLEIDQTMLGAAAEVWADEIQQGKVAFINEDIEGFSDEIKFDFVICVNAFMYFASAEKALRNLMKAARYHLIIRSYFTDANYRIVRAQTKQNHEKSHFDEVDVFDEQGNMLCYDFWNMYSHSYIESIVAKINPNAKLEWVEDNNVFSSIEEERNLNLMKRGATELLGGREISYPFFLPWKYLVISFYV